MIDAGRTRRSPPLARLRKKPMRGFDWRRRGGQISTANSSLGSRAPVHVMGRGRWNGASRMVDVLCQLDLVQPPFRPAQVAVPKAASRQSACERRRAHRTAIIAKPTLTKKNQTAARVTNQPAHVARRAVNAGLWLRDTIEIEKKDHRSILQIFSMN